MLIFKKIELRNFLSFGNCTTELDLEFTGTTLILGENKDASGANGVGKSTIINGISFALYNKPISNISKERLINRTNNAKSTTMEIRLSFIKDDVEYEIYRSRGETNATVLKRADVDITPDSVSNIDKAIEDIVGFSYELFSRVVVFAGSAQPFLDLPVSTQRNHIEELFNIKTLSQKALILREKIKLTESDIKVQEALIKQQEITNELYRKHLAEAETRVLSWEDDTQSKIETIITSLDSLKDINFDAEQEIHAKVASLNTEIATVEQRKKTFHTALTSATTAFEKWFSASAGRTIQINKKLALITGVDVEAEQHLHLRVTELTELLNKTESEKKLQTTLENQITKRIAEIENELKHLSDSRCPYCSQVYNSGDKIAELKKEKEEKDALLVDSAVKIANFKIDALSYTESLAKAKAAIKYPNLSELMAVHAEAQSLRDELYLIEHSENPHVNTIADLLVAEDIAPDNILPMFIADKLSVSDIVTDGTSNKLLNALQEERDAAKAAIKHTDLAKLLNVKANANQLAIKLEEYKTAVNPHLAALQSLIDDGETKIDIDTLDKLKSYLEHQQFLLKLLTDKNSYIRKNIINQTIPFLNLRINRYTKELGLPHVVKFDSDMSCLVTECGRELDFGNLSGGEKKRVNLALSIAFRDVLHHLHSKVNLLMLDEPDGGSIDHNGVDALVHLLKSKSRDEDMSIWLISHHPAVVNRCTRELIVRKENGFSTLIHSE